MSVIVVEQLTRRYGRRVGIERLSLEVGQGELLGFLGPNGAGKTTTIRLALGLLRPTRGSLRVLGLDSRRDRVQVHRRAGYLPGELALYSDLTGEQLLHYLGNLRGHADWAYS